MAPASLELNLDPCAAAKVADALRRELVNQRERFVFETVFSDPVGDKVSLHDWSATTRRAIPLRSALSGGPVHFSQPEERSADGKKVSGPVAHLIDGKEETTWNADRGLGGGGGWRGPRG
jgi:hypothetical protein